MSIVYTVHKANTIQHKRCGTYINDNEGTLTLSLQEDRTP